MSHIQITDLASGIELEQAPLYIFGGRIQSPSRILPADGNEFGVVRPRPIVRPTPVPAPIPAPAPYYPPVSSPPPGFTVPIPGGFAAGGTNPFGSPDVY